MSASADTIQSGELREFVRELFLASGCLEKHAGILSEKLILSNLYGVDSHGVLRVPIYIKRLRSGAMNPRPEFKVIKDSGPIRVIDGDNAPGFLVGHCAMKTAIGIARKHGIAVCGAVGSNHFGAAQLYARMASDEGMVGIAMTNVAPLMSMPGALGPIIGNNPFAISAPADPFPVVLDVSLSNVALGKVLLAQQKGEKIPADWAIDTDGKPTTDPAAAVAGYLLPMGGHKGFGIAVMIDLLCGVLTGGAFLNDLKGMYKFPDDPSVTAHLMIVIDPDKTVGKEAFAERMAQFCGTIHATPTAHGAPGIILPGEPEYRTFLKRSSEGIPVNQALRDELNALAADLSVARRL